MKYVIVPLPPFNKQLKQLAKRYASILNDVQRLRDSLEISPTQGDRIKEECYKIRMAVSSKNKGKSGGARVITYIKIVQETVFLLSIYDKSDQANIGNPEIEAILEEYDLLPDDDE